MLLGMGYQAIQKQEETYHYIMGSNGTKAMELGLMQRAYQRAYLMLSMSQHNNLSLATLQFNSELMRRMELALEHTQVFYRFNPMQSLNT